MSEIKRKFKFSNKSPFRVIAGSYVRLLYGLDAIVGKSEEYSCTGKYLATGSTDETIKVYDSRRKKEIGSLTHHSGTVTCLEFWEHLHLISGGEDGSITLWRTEDWAELKTLVGHEDAVLSIALHPSGGVLLSTSRDGTLKCWDLQNGKLAYSTRLVPKYLLSKMKLTGSANVQELLGEPLKVLWLSEKRFVVMFDRGIKVFSFGSVEQSDNSWEQPIKTRLNGMAVLDESNIVVGGEDTLLYRINVDTKTVSALKTDHPSRIKDIAKLNTAHLPKDAPAVIATCSSDGLILCFTAESLREAQVEAKPIAKYDAKVRLTCLSLAPVFQRRTKE